LGFLLYQAMYAPMVFLKALYRQLILLASMFGLGAWIFMYFDHLPFLTALLASVSTITTIEWQFPQNTSH
jgi:hypothetical protein